MVPKRPKQKLVRFPGWVLEVEKRQKMGKREKGHKLQPPETDPINLVIRFYQLRSRLLRE